MVALINDHTGRYVVFSIAEKPTRWDLIRTWVRRRLRRIKDMTKRLVRVDG